MKKAFRVSISMAWTVVAVLLFSAWTVAHAGVPSTMNFQGVLTDSTGAPVADGTYDMNFFLYDSETGLSQLWTEAQTVTVTGGVYNIQLGAVVPLSSSVFDGGVAWLEVVVEGETMSPRQQLTSTAFALKAGDADTLAGNDIGDLDARYVQEGQAGAVNSTMIADGTIGAADLGANSVGSSEIAAGGVGSSEVHDNSLTAADLAADSVGNSELAPNSVGSVEIINGEVTAADMADGAARAEILDDDGAGSLLDADYLDGLSSESFVRTNQDYGRSGVASNLYEGTATLTSKYVNESGDYMAGSTTASVLTVDNNADTGGGDAIYGRTYAPTGIGVAGFSMDTGAVQNEGGRFMAYGDTGRGVYGKAASSDAGTNYGGYFEALGSTGMGVFGQATNTGSYTNYGGYFTASGAYGRGVYGYATNTGNYTNYGGYFTASGQSGRGVYGVASNATGTNSGGYFTSSGATGRGVYAYASGTNGYGIYAVSSEGDGIYGATSASDEHAGFFYSSASVSLTGAVLYARNYNSSGQGIALHAHNDYSTSTDAAAVLSNDGSGPLLKGFGGNGGEDEFRFDNDGTLRLYNSSHYNTATFYADYNDYGHIRLMDTTGSYRLSLSGGASSGGGGIWLRNADGATTVSIYGDYSGTGDGRVVTNELQITGGSDLSEQFDVKAAEDGITPGMVVSIDPARPGQLMLSQIAYDNKVAGIISGAGGIKPGMMMGQAGTEADGQHPVALTGRVYCWADATGGAIQPGDLLTTAQRPGHAMKVTDHTKANGAILGKAMTSLEKGTGLVLVLVSLQ